MKDALFTGFWISLLTGSITWGATYSFGYGLAAFLVGFLAFGVDPALYEEGKAHGSKKPLTFWRKCLRRARTTHGRSWNERWLLTATL